MITLPHNQADKWNCPGYHQLVEDIRQKMLCDRYHLKLADIFSNLPLFSDHSSYVGLNPKKDSGQEN